MIFRFKMLLTLIDGYLVKDNGVHLSKSSKSNRKDPRRDFNESAKLKFF